MNTKDTTMIHTTVLLKESIDGLAIKDGDVYVDGTLGSGGHAQYALETAQKNGAKIIVIGLDRDQGAINRSRARLGDKPNISYVLANYKDIDITLGELGIAFADKIMLDLGLSSDQFETSGRGFSFRKNEPLLMTFKEVGPGASSVTSASSSSEQESEGLADGALTASKIVNEWAEDDIANLIFQYGEEHYAKRIAHEIVKRREEMPFVTTYDLVDAIMASTPTSYHHMKIHPATRTFQALRMAVNDELGSLTEGLERGFNRLSPGGRMAVISFHSIEDRIVKRFMQEKEKQEKANLITKKPIDPSSDELRDNPRSRSAKLRIIEKR